MWSDPLMDQLLHSILVTALWLMRNEQLIYVLVNFNQINSFILLLRSKSARKKAPPMNKVSYLDQNTNLCAVATAI